MSNPVWDLLPGLVQYARCCFDPATRHKLYLVQEPFGMQFEESRILSCFKRSSAKPACHFMAITTEHESGIVQIPYFAYLPIHTARGLGLETLLVGYMSPPASYLHYQIQEQTQNRREACRWSGLATWHASRKDEPNCSLGSQTTQQRSHNEQSRPRTHEVVGELTKFSAKDEFITQKSPSVNKQINGYRFYEIIHRIALCSFHSEGSFTT